MKSGVYVRRSSQVAVNLKMLNYECMIQITVLLNRKVNALCTIVNMVDDKKSIHDNKI